jgi:hypothetical protein
LRVVPCSTSFFPTSSNPLETTGSGSPRILAISCRADRLSADETEESKAFDMEPPSTKTMRGPVA